MITKQFLKIWLLSVNIKNSKEILLHFLTLRRSRINEVVIDLNSRREFNYYRKTSILFIIEEL